MTPQNSPPEDVRVTARDEDDVMRWEAYCPTCQDVLDQSSDGVVIEACARTHVRDSGHETLVAFRMRPVPKGGA